MHAIRLPLCSLTTSQPCTPHSSHHTPHTLSSSHSIITSLTPSLHTQPHHLTALTVSLPSQTLPSQTLPSPCTSLRFKFTPPHHLSETHSPSPPHSLTLSPPHPLTGSLPMATPTSCPSKLHYTASQLHSPHSPTLMLNPTHIQSHSSTVTHTLSPRLHSTCSLTPHIRTPHTQTDYA